jgi:hypothetical protein
MKRKSNKVVSINKKKAPYDLFGEIPVTWDEVYLWCEVVTRGKFSRANRNLMLYVEGYNVIGKIKTAKIQGDFDLLIGRAANSIIY